MVNRNATIRLARRLTLGSCSALVLLGLGGQPSRAIAQDKPAAAVQEKIGKLPHVEFNIDKKQVRVECEALAVNAPLEFFVCMAGTAEHEAVMRSAAKPSHIHTGLLAIGLKPGQPLTFLEATRRFLPPQGPALHITVEYEKDGKTISFPAYRWIRDIKTKKEPKAFTWIFAGSRVTPEGHYGADDTGYTATLVNFDYAMIDIPDLASSSNETLEWERNADLMPPKGTKVWMVIEPAGLGAPKAANGAAADTTIAPNVAASAGTSPATQPTGTESGFQDEVKIDELKVQRMKAFHDKMLGPRQQAIKEAAEAHYKAIAELRKEQQRLITEADRIQRAIDELEKDWNDAVTPRPDLGPTGQPGGALTPPGTN